MKIIFTTLLTLIAFSGFSQKDKSDTLKYFKLNNGSVYFENVYQAEGTKEEIKSRLTDWVHKLPSVSEVIVGDDRITGKFVKANFPYKKYVGAWKASGLIMQPYNANFEVSIKDGKYRAVVTGIFFDGDLSIKYGAADIDIADGIELFAYHKRQDRLIDKRNPGKFVQARGFEDYLYDIFNITSPTVQEDW